MYQGLLRRRVDENQNVWDERWFCLVEGKLFCFRKDCSKPCGFLDLQEVDSLEVRPRLCHLIFHVQPTSLSPTLQSSALRAHQVGSPDSFRKLVLQAPSTAEMLGWSSAIINFQKRRAKRTGTRQPRDADEDITLPGIPKSRPSGHLARQQSANSLLEELSQGHGKQSQPPLLSVAVATPRDRKDPTNSSPTNSFASTTAREKVVSLWDSDPDSETEEITLRTPEFDSGFSILEVGEQDNWVLTRQLQGKGEITRGIAGEKSTIHTGLPRLNLKSASSGQERLGQKQPRGMVGGLESARNKKKLWSIFSADGRVATRQYVFAELIGNTAKDGDVLLFQTRGVIAGLVRMATIAPYDHVAILYKTQRDHLMMLESTTEGVTCRSWSSFIISGKFKQYSKVKLRSLIIGEQEFHMTRDRLLDFVSKVHGQEYGIGPRKLLRRRSLDGAERRTYFCSELVAAAYKHMGILSKELSSSQYMPGHFSSSFQLSMLKQAELGLEMELVFPTLSKGRASKTEPSTPRSLSLSNSMTNWKRTLYPEGYVRPDMEQQNSESDNESDLQKSHSQGS